MYFQIYLQIYFVGRDGFLSENPTTWISSIKGSCKTLGLLKMIQIMLEIIKAGEQAVISI